MKKNWFQRNPGLTLIILWGGVIFNFERVLSEHFPEYSLLIGLTAAGAVILSLMWGLTQKGYSYGWLLLVIPIPVAYFFMKNKLELPKNIKV